jgi:hypothetical protein
MADAMELQQLSLQAEQERIPTHGCQAVEQVQQQQLFAQELTLARSAHLQVVQLHNHSPLHNQQQLQHRQQPPLQHAAEQMEPLQLQQQAALALTPIHGRQAVEQEQQPADLQQDHIQLP